MIPIVTDAARDAAAGRRRRRASATAACATSCRAFPREAVCRPRLGERVPQYRDLEPRTTTDVLAEPGIVELTLPSRRRADAVEQPRSARIGRGDFPPALEDTNLADRVITWLRICVVDRALPSQLKWVGINAAMVSQRAHVANEVLPDGTGEPDQIVALSRRPIVAGSVRLRVTANNVTDEWTARSTIC